MCMGVSMCPERARGEVEKENMPQGRTADAAGRRREPLLENNSVLQLLVSLKSFMHTRSIFQRQAVGLEEGAGTFSGKNIVSVK